MLLKTNSIFLGGWEINFTNKDELARFIVTHATDKEGFAFFNSVQSGLELVINHNKIVKVYEHAAGEKDLLEINTKVGKPLLPMDLPIVSWKQNKIFSIEKSKNGEHIIGGETPSNYKLPTHKKLLSPFKYIGKINGQDEHFKWLGVDELNISFPVYECCLNGLFLDYSNANNPTIINPEIFTDSWKDGIPKDVEKIIFQKSYYKTKDYIDVDKYENSKDVILCGIPLWYQEPSVPVCPKSKKIMRYVCSINSNSELRAFYQDTNEMLGEHDYLCFGDVGNLFVFWEPDSRILHLEAQW